LCFAAFRVEKAVVEVVLEACQPIGIEASLQVLNAEGKEQDQKRRRLELALERVRYEAERAQRQYNAVDPANRLVAAELEARWNAALAQVAEAEARLESEEQSRTSLSEEQRDSLLGLGANLHAVWNDGSFAVFCG
jgi:FKBP-type peptidyl-prolyl cis-trans isomerase (trigger factor)